MSTVRERRAKQLVEAVFEELDECGILTDDLASKHAADRHLLYRDLLRRFLEILP